MIKRERFLALVLGLLSITIFLMILPFLGYILGAALLAFVLYPLQTKLQEFISPRLSAFLLVTISLFLLVLPTLFLSIILIEETADVAETIDESEILDLDYMEDLIEEYTGAEIDIREGLVEAAESFSEVITAGLSQFLGILVDTAIGLLLLIFILFYLLKDGERFTNWVKNMLPLPKEVKNNLQQSLSSTTWAVIKGHIFVSIAQAIFVGLAFAIIGIPNYIFWTFIMIILGFIPLIGTVLVWLPASIYLIITTNTGIGITLFLYSTIVTVLSDEYIRPLAVDRDTDLHPASILVGILGGIYLLGPVGLFIGPVIIGGFRDILTIYDQELHKKESYNTEES